MCPAPVTIQKSCKTQLQKGLHARCTMAETGRWQRHRISKGVHCSGRFYRRSVMIVPAGLVDMKRLSHCPLELTRQTIRFSGRRLGWQHHFAAGALDLPFALAQKRIAWEDRARHFQVGKLMHVDCLHMCWLMKRLLHQFAYFRNFTLSLSAHPGWFMFILASLGASISLLHVN